FCIYELGIDGVILGSAMIFVRIWDAVNDPIMGTIVDRTRLKSGKMRPYLLFMPFLMALSTAALFLVPQSLSAGAKLAFSICGYLLWDLTYTITDVPFWGLPSAMTPNNGERAVFLSRARLFNSIGGALPYLLYLFISDNKFKPGFLPTLLVMLVVFTVPFLLTYFVTTERLRVDEDEKKPNLSDNMKLLALNKPLLLVGLFAILCFGRYMVQSAYGYAAASVFYSSNSTVDGMKSLLGAALIGAGMFPAMLAMPKLMRKYNYKQLAIGIALFGFVADMIFFIVGMAVKFDLLPLLPFLFISGIPLGAYNILIVALVADCVDYLEWKTGKRAEGICLAVNTFSSKLGSGLASAIMPFVLGMTGRLWGAEGFIAQLPEGTEQSYKVKVVIFTCLALVPSISMLLASIPMKWFKFVGKEKETALKELNERRVINENL
ncbi:MAG: hypothetical protein GX851_07675, partial [Clostridiales bacterium]|nr:hypothetical protein [Clostridiales bacterium]